MKIAREYRKSLIVLLMISALWLNFFNSTINVYGNETIDWFKIQIAMTASIENENIIVKVIPKGFWGSPIYNTMNQTQIWGDYGKGWFLIKDYDIECSRNQQFTWDLKSLDKKNEEKASSYVKGNTDRLKIYVRFRRILTGGCNDYEELYKTFYLGDPEQDVQLTTGQEKEKYAPVSYDFPVEATQGHKVQLDLDSGADSQKQYQVKVIGDNGYEEEIQQKNGNSKVLEWKPKEVGTFYIAVYDERSQMVLRRKVYVNSNNKKYLQLDNLSVQNENDIVYVRLKVADTRPNGFKEKEMDKSLKFVISEPNYWSKTIKDYDDVVDYDKGKGTYEVNERDDGFRLGSGNYNISGYIKSPHSVEYDDAITKSYKKSGLDDVDFEIGYDSNGCKSEKGIYPLSQFGKQNNLTFHFWVKNPQEDLEYAFFLEDARGKRCVKEYSDNPRFNWKPVDPGEYKIYGRVRQEWNKNSGTLQNSYEKEVAIPIHIGYLDRFVKIKEIHINDDEWMIDDGKATHTHGNGKIESHKINVIEIKPQKVIVLEGKTKKIFDDIIHTDDLMYKVCVVAKGHYYTIAPYSFSNKIPLYPKNEGPYRLIVMVKTSASGSYEDYCEIKVNAEG